MQNIISQCIGLTIKAKAFLQGQREGKAILFEAGAYPYGAVAPVQFMWQPHSPSTKKAQTDASGSQGCVAESGNQNLVKLWMWCHPASREQVLSELQKTIKSHNDKMSLYERSAAGKEEAKNGLPSVLNTVSVAPRNLVRFRLVGPRSHAVLMETLKLVWNAKDNLPFGSAKRGEEEGSDSGYNWSDIELEEEENGEDGGGGDGSQPEEGFSLPPMDKWWLSESGVLEDLALHAELLSTEYPSIKSASDPSEFSRGAVVGLCVQDPRLFTPSKATDMVSSYYPVKRKSWSELNGGLGEESTSASPDESFEMTPEASVLGSPPSSSMPDSLPPEVAYSPIWEGSLCASVSKSKIPDHFLNRKRSEKFIKASVLRLGDASPQIPVVLVQQPPSPSTSSPTPHRSLGAGWDLILPPEWGMAFWIALVYRGARACGMKELHKASIESQVLHFPQDFPDTAAGLEHNSEQRKEREEQYLTKPPAKRLNYGKLLVATPFHISWESLVGYWSRKCRPRCRGVKREAPSTEEDVPCKRGKLEISGESSEHLKWSSGENAPLESEDSSEEFPSQSFYVLRSREDLNSLKLFVSTLVTNKKKASELRFPKRVMSEESTVSWIKVLEASAPEISIATLLRKHSDALVAVQVEVNTSGTLRQLDTLSLPSPSDFSSLLATSPHFTGPKEDINQHGMTVVRKGGIVVGISSLHRKEVKEAMKKKEGGGWTGLYKC